MEDDVLKQDPDDEISLIDLFAVMWQRRGMIISTTLVAAVAVVVASVLSLRIPSERSFLPNEFSPKAHMLVNNPSSGSGNGLSSMLNSGGLSSLASLAGLNISGSTQYSDLAQYLVTTNTFLDAVVDEFGLVERYKIKKFPRAGSRKALEKKLKPEYDKISGVFTIEFSDYDPEFAQRVVNFSVNYLGVWFNGLGLDKNVLQKANYEQNIQNTFEEIRRLEAESHDLDRTVTRGGQAAGSLPSIMLESRRIALELSAQQEIYKQLKVQLELVNVAIASEMPVLQILEMAEVPDQKSKPSRGLLCIIVTFAALFFSVFVAFLLNAVDNIRQDPGAMEKLRPRQRGGKDI